MKKFYNHNCILTKYYLLVIILLIYGCGKESNKSANIDNEGVSQQETNFNNEYKWRLPELTFYEKKKFMNSVNIVFRDIYVNRMQKIKDLNYDPLVDAKSLDARMTSVDLLKKIKMITTKIRDAHTKFIYPFPAQCFNAYFPLNVKLAYEKTEGSSTRNLVISKIYTKTELAHLGISLLPNDINNYQNIQLGDQIISITNLGLEGITKTEISSENALSELGKATFGANKDSFYSVASFYLFRRDGGTFELPKGNLILKIKHLNNGKISHYTFPWIYLNSQNPLCSEENIKSLEKMESRKTFTNKNSILNNFITDLNENENIFTKIVLRNEKKIAIIKIKSFFPEGVNKNIENDSTAFDKVEEEVMLIRQFITEKKDQIEGIIFDVRDNGGGIRRYPQMLANIFTHQYIAPPLLQTLVSPLNKDIFYYLGNHPYFSRAKTKYPIDKFLLRTALDIDQLLHDKTKIREIYRRELLLTQTRRFDGLEEKTYPPYNIKSDSLFKDIFTTKPIAVLTNSNCFSTCEIFVATFKDKKIARIFSETKHTGGAGSIDIGWNELTTPVDINNDEIQNQIVPNGSPLPMGSDFRFSLSKILRESSTSEEKYIEGIGVLPDYVYKPTVEDIKNNDNIIFGKIMDDILDKSNSKRFYLNR